MVLLETSWVLRSVYGFEESAIREAFTKLLGLKNVQAEDGILRGGRFWRLPSTESSSPTPCT